MQGDFSNLEFVVANDGSLVIHGDVTVTGTLTVSGADTGPTSQVVEVDFGHSREDGVVIKTVSAPWILADSTVEVVVRAVTTADHDPEDVAVEALSCYASNIIPGVGFDVYCSAPNSTWGRYSLLATG
jgi:hypothetical protein